VIRSRRGLLLGFAGGICLLVVIIALVLTARAHARTTPAQTQVAPVALSQWDVPSSVRVGVIVTLGQGDIEGSEWVAAADGAVVAGHRLADGGHKVELLVENDHGTAIGGAEAVDALVDRGVSGIVLASSGSHIAPAVLAAAEAGVPVVLPYAALPDAVLETEGAWSLAPTEEEVAGAIDRALASFAHPLLLEAGADLIGHPEIADVLRSRAGDLTMLAAAAAENEKADVVVIDARPREAAEIVAELQARRVTAPTILPANAVSPAFAQAFGERGGEVSPALSTVGIAAGDSWALESGSEGRAMSAYLQAVRQLANDENVTNLIGDASFVESASWADARSHDAVLAIVAAAAAAGSGDAERVRAGFDGLRLGVDTGIAGPELDFASTRASVGDVLMLHATGQSLGLRPSARDAPGLSWFPGTRDR